MKDGMGEIDPDGWIRCQGLKMPKDGALVKGRVRGRIKRQVYEEGMAKAALEAVENGDRVLELGTGLGYVTALLAKQYTLEAFRTYDGHAGALAYAEAMLATNGILDVDLIHGVLDRRKGQRVFHICDPFLRSSLTPDPGRERSRGLVPAENAKTVFSSFRPTVLICDISGAEVDVLPLADFSTLDRAVVKLSGGMQPPGELVKSVFDTMSAAGFVYASRMSERTIVGFQKLAPTA